uniref:Helicase C-terminal domain-containing protein n=1 Tax=Cyclophora tenuis TaxID=216820 RepID=A0A7S1CWA0_CYCTE
MALALAKDMGAIYWREGFGPREERDATAVVSVLQYEDSLSQRASAMRGFQGVDGGSIEGRRLEHNHNDDDKDDSDQEDIEEEEEIKEEMEEDGRVRILLSTDLAARGLDVVDVSHVIQFDLAPDTDTYVHRAGRTGRLGRRGTVVSIITHDEEFVLDRLANQLQLQQSLHCLARQNNKNSKINKKSQPHSLTTT